VGKAKAHLELNLTGDVKDNKKGFFKYISSKRKSRDNVGPLLNEVGTLVTEDAEKVELLNACLPRSSLLRPALRNPGPWR